MAAAEPIPALKRSPDREDGMASRRRLSDAVAEQTGRDLSLGTLESVAREFRDRTGLATAGKMFVITGFVFACFGVILLVLDLLPWSDAGVFTSSPAACSARG
jgi:hypothetical protein